MSHEIDLKNINIRTDMIVDTIDTSSDNSDIKSYKKEFDNISVEEIIIDKKSSEIYKRKNGIYKTLTFKDITDKDNFKKVEKVLIDEIRDLMEKLKISNNASCLIIGLGNNKSTPDSLGPKCIENVLVTRYLFDLGEVEEGYRNTSSFTPGVTGTTGIETKKLIEGVVNVSKPDFLIIIDALASSSIERVNKTIQITDVGIAPGSGVGNNREELNSKTFNIPTIAIGVPTIVDAVTIVSDTFKYMMRQFNYKLENLDNKKLKFVDELHQNYLNEEGELSFENREKILGIVGTLKDDDLKKLIYEVLSPIDYNLMVTPKEIDFIMEKLSLLIANSINKVLHKSYNTTN
mgnify:FL=1